jgi:hypothetical protein
VKIAAKAMPSATNVPITRRDTLASAPNVSAARTLEITATRACGVQPVAFARGAGVEDLDSGVRAASLMPVMGFPFSCVPKATRGTEDDADAHFRLHLDR